MDFLNKTYARLFDVIRAMSPGARLVSAALLGVVLISFGLLFGYRSGEADLYLMNGQSFRPNDLPAMEAAFAKAGLASYQFEGTRIRVPRGQQNTYVAALAENNALPENYREIMDGAFKNLRPWSSKTEQEQLIKDAKRRQLEAIIREMRGVQSAYVLCDAEKAPGLRQETLRTASVNVTMTAGERLSPAQFAAIRTVVSKAFVNLPPASVAVTDLTNVGAEPAADAIGPDDPYIARKQFYERQWRENILRALTYVPGVTVVANVELDRDQSRRTETVRPDPVRAPAAESGSQPAASDRGGENRPVSPIALVNMALSIDELSIGRRSENREALAVSTVGTRETTEGVGLTPTRVTVAIGVPNSYFLKVWRERHLVGPASQVAPEPAAIELVRTDEIKRIKDHVAKLLPPVTGVTDPCELVQVTSFVDLAPPPAVAAPVARDRAIEWLAEHWSAVGMFGVILVGMLLLRSVVRGSGSAKPVAEPPGEVLDLTEEIAESASAAVPHYVGEPSRSFRDKLSQLVQEDPDAAAGVLRSWIGSASGK